MDDWHQNAAWAETERHNQRMRDMREQQKHREQREQQKRREAPYVFVTWNGLSRGAAKGGSEITALPFAKTVMDLRPGDKVLMSDDRWHGIQSVRPGKWNDEDVTLIELKRYDEEELRAQAEKEIYEAGIMREDAERDYIIKQEFES